MNNAPVFIIGAARSGTKILRAALSNSEEITALPYDVNYIWKYGNYGVPHDELTAYHNRPEVESFIKNYFSKHIGHSNKKMFLEKTVSNSLRISFVKSIFPEGKIIHLYRDGRDVAADARSCWQASAFDERLQSKSDLFKKIIHFPVKAAYLYILNYAKSYLKKNLSFSDHVDSWGPRFEGIDAALKSYSLLEVCGLQWNNCVEKSLRDLSNLDEGYDYINVRYEDLVTHPISVLQFIADFLHIVDFRSISEFAETTINSQYVGAWVKALTEVEMRTLLPHIDKNLKRLAYI